MKVWPPSKTGNVSSTSTCTAPRPAGLTLLESLDVGSTLMTDVGLERLTSLTNLRALTMGGNELGDAGMQALRQMPNLTYLDLSGR
jgi:Leucine-rich repeat (LRR) protein